MKEFNPNVSERLNQQGKCGFCGKSLKGKGVRVYTNGSEVENNAAYFQGQGYMEVIVGSECAKKKII